MSLIFPSISVLIPDLKSGDRVAWNNLCDKFRVGLTSKTRYLLQSANTRGKYCPDDLVQETFLKAWRRHETFRGKTTSQFAQWILTILRNTFRDWCRSVQPESTVSTWFGFSDQSNTPSAAFISVEDEACLHACLAELDTRHQNILVLRHFEGLKFSEIADRTGLNPNTVAGIYRRGLVRLSELLNNYTGQADLLTG